VLASAVAVGALSPSAADAAEPGSKPAVAKACANTGTYVKPDGKKAKNSGKHNPGKLFKGRPNRQDEDEERNTGETANLAGYTATVTAGEFVQSLSSFENDGYLKLAVKICNRNSDPQQTNIFDWKVQTPAGNQIDPDISSIPTLQTGTLVKGGEVAGDLVFAIDGQKGDFFVIYKPVSDPFNDIRGIWKITV